MLEKRGLIERDAENAWLSNDPSLLRVGYPCRTLDLAGQVIGYGVVSLGAGEAHILNVCVREEYRSVGFGRRLLEHLMERAAAGGVNEAFLEVRPSNLAAIRLYQRLGFEQIGIRRGYYQARGDARLPSFRIPTMSCVSRADKLGRVR